ncbi:hypothetical protein PAMA_017889 [Pampus argenteus]
MGFISQQQQQNKISPQISDGYTSVQEVILDLVLSEAVMWSCGLLVRTGVCYDHLLFVEQLAADGPTTGLQRWQPNRHWGGSALLNGFLTDSF